MKKYLVEFCKVRHLFKKHLPLNVVKKLQIWAKKVEMIGLEETRKIKGLHDEPLKGDRVGQRSIRLNNAYRAIYEIHEDDTIVIIDVVEVNKHEY
ncbi:MAG: type II toxin-antitoxin system mRNA interferase toxin, RelE/StbE family [Oligoflexia bacterium]|nr:type II toxin-antitoxin system mRNA interferase toxin, RelE/StbE family [Oligoflexia bacterium]